MRGRVAIFGGSFNPIHWGHLLIAEAARDQFQLDRVLWVPSYAPPHKAPVLLPFSHRLEMVRRAIADHHHFTVSDIESQRAGPSYAIDTLANLQAEQPEAQWYWIVGWDAFQSLSRWQGFEALVKRCSWLVAPRDPDGMQQTQIEQLSPFLRWQLIEIPTTKLSSSLIRQRCHENRSIRYWVPESVRLYIEMHQLYR